MHAWYILYIIRNNYINNYNSVQYLTDICPEFVYIVYI